MQKVYNRKKLKNSKFTLHETDTERRLQEGGEP